MVIPQEYKPTTDLYKDAYLGSNDVFVKKLKYLSQIAQEENWDYEKSDVKEYKLLRNYLLYTYDRVKQESKIEYSENGELMCFNTGLLTPNEVDIYALFNKNDSTRAKEGQIWHLVGFYQASHRKMLEEFPKYPEIADYFTNSSDFIYDRNMDIVINYDHIVDDNYERFAAIGYDDKETIKAFLKSGGITGVRCYAGYIQKGNHTYAVAVLSNNYSCSMRQMTKDLEKLLLQLLR